MKYTMSTDGVPRVSVRVILRFTEDEIAEIKRQAKELGSDWRTWLQSHAALGVEEQLIIDDGAYLQRYGKGDA